MWGGEIFVFPNLMLLPQAGNCMIYRVRPAGFDPDNCVFEILSTKTYPAAIKPQRAIVQKVTDNADPEQVRLATSTVIERRLAVAWLRGEDPLYSEGSLDT